MSSFNAMFLRLVLVEVLAGVLLAPRSSAAPVNGSSLQFLDHFNGFVSHSVSSSINGLLGTAQKADSTEGLFNSVRKDVG